MLREHVLCSLKTPEDLPAAVPQQLSGGLPRPSRRPKLVETRGGGDAVQHGEVTKVAEQALDLTSRDAVN